MLFSPSDVKVPFNSYNLKTTCCKCISCNIVTRQCFSEHVKNVDLLLSSLPLVTEEQRGRRCPSVGLCLVQSYRCYQFELAQVRPGLCVSRYCSGTARVTFFLCVACVVDITQCTCTIFLMVWWRFRNISVTMFNFTS